ncbi:nucleotidyltransferase family protein [Bacteroidota bacterium]
MKKDLAQILKILRELNNYIQKEYKVSSIEVFGSYVHNRNKSNSDLDLLVSFSETPGLLKFIELKNFLSDKIGIKVDLVIRESIKSRLRESILRNAIQL